MLENCDFISFVNYDTRENYSCESSGCYEEGICRCSTIEEVTIKSVSITELAEEIFYRFDSNDVSFNRNKKLCEILWNYDYETINQYCVDRILSINKLWESSNWYPKIFASYYGEEIEDIIIQNELFSKVVSQIEKAIEITTLEEKVFYLLKLEYGSVLHNLIDKKMYIETINFEQISFTQKSHQEKVKTKDLSFYSDYDLIKGLVRKKGQKYHIIDGYHRLSANKNKKVTVIVVE